MTAEIAIMNAQAVALAADSAVTFGSKVKNTANKIFAMSKFQPIAAMVYNNSDFAGLPWETVIKSYRNNLGPKSFDTVKEYAVDFFDYLVADQLIKTATVSPSRVNEFLDAHFLTVRESAMIAISEEIATTGAVTTARITALIADALGKHVSQLEKEDPKLRKTSRRLPVNKIDERIEVVFDQLPLTKSIRNSLRKLARYVVRAFPIAPHSGFVIAGFGRNELFPALESYSVYIFADFGVLVARDERSSAISIDEPVFVIPFAQSEVVATFMDGVEPSYQILMDNLIESILREYPAEILKRVPSLSDTDRAKLVKKFRASGAAVADQYLHELQHVRIRAFSGPITSVVQSLPKDELAAMAESLVNLTSFKRKVSLDEETVGGPIDVAVISKGDGMIWIKRKHYFEPRFNPQFFDLYYWRHQHGEAKKSAQDANA